MYEFKHDDFNEVGTLKEWKNEHTHVLFPLHTIQESLRGGAFWCLPNFEEDTKIFSIKHGEYRKLALKDTILPHTKQLSSSWGSIDVRVMWEKRNRELETSATLFCNKDGTHVRPGFHPYFSVFDDFLIECEGKTVTKTTLDNDSLLFISCTPDTEKTITLRTGSQFITLTVTVVGWKKVSPPTISFGVWSDNRDMYVCLEPVIGYGEEQNGLPEPFTMDNNDTLSCVCHITSEF